jgi:hypothetical protein
MNLAEYKREIVLRTILGVVVVLLLALAVVVFASGNEGFLPSPVTTTPEEKGFAPIGFGSVPYLAVSSGSTLSVQVEVTAQDSVSLDYNASDSYAIAFSNGTRWVYSSSCNPMENMSDLVRNSTTGTDICSFAADNYLPENGIVVNPMVNLTTSNTTISVSPSNITSRFNGNIILSLRIGLPPGVYSLDIFLDVRSNGGAPISWSLGPSPLVVYA